jgi:hypothetical protein
MRGWQVAPENDSDASVDLLKAWPDYWHSEKGLTAPSIKLQRFSPSMLATMDTIAYSMAFASHTKMSVFTDCFFARQAYHRSAHARKHFAEAFMRMDWTDVL